MKCEEGGWKLNDKARQKINFSYAILYVYLSRIFFYI